MHREELEQLDGDLVRDHDLRSNLFQRAEGDFASGQKQLAE